MFMITLVVAYEGIRRVEFALTREDAEKIAVALVAADPVCDASVSISEVAPTSFEEQNYLIPKFLWDEGDDSLYKQTDFLPQVDEDTPQTENYYYLRGAALEYISPFTYYTRDLNHPVLEELAYAIRLGWLDTKSVRLFYEPSDNEIHLLAWDVVSISEGEETVGWVILD